MCHNFSAIIACHTVSTCTFSKSSCVGPKGSHGYPGSSGNN